MKYNSILLILLILLLTSCHKEETIECIESKEETFVFGTYYGECLGNCAKLFKIENCQLFEDDMDYFYNSELDFLNTPMSDEKYTASLEVLEEFPDELWSVPSETVFGTPDAYDQGGIFIQKTYNGETKEWNLDTTEADLPEYLRAYAALIKEKVIELYQ